MKPFDKIIFRQIVNKGERWKCGFYSHENTEYVVLINDISINKAFYEILPFEGNEELVGTTKNVEESITIEPGTPIFLSDCLREELDYWTLDKFEVTDDDYISGQYGAINIYCILFSDFDPNNMKETLKKAMTIKNNKLVMCEDD